VSYLFLYLYVLCALLGMLVMFLSVCVLVQTINCQLLGCVSDCVVFVCESLCQYISVCVCGV